MSNEDPTLPHEDPNTLLDRVLARDEEAWRRMTDLFAPLVYRWARRSGLQEADAADVAQEVFRQVASSLHQFREEHGEASFQRWLWSITRNRVRLHFRQQSGDVRSAGGTDSDRELKETQAADRDPGEVPDLEGEVRRFLLHRVLRMIRQDFQESTWEAFWRVTMERASIADTARELEMTPTAVRQAKYRVLCRLREEIAVW